MSLIEDYIKLILIKNFLNNSLEKNLDNLSLEKLNKNKILNLELENSYNLIFNKLKLNDLSLLILNKELKNKCIAFSEENNDFSKLFAKISVELNQIATNLKEKMKILKLDCYSI